MLELAQEIAGAEDDAAAVVAFHTDTVFAGRSHAEALSGAGPLVPRLDVDDPGAAPAPLSCVRFSISCAINVRRLSSLRRGAGRSRILALPQIERVQG